MDTRHLHLGALIRLWNRMNALQLLALGFAAIILIGALLLRLPMANKSGETIPFIAALFTSTSATCVTGLIVYDTYTHFTTFGQLVLLALIQIGGLGFMTIAVLFSMLLGKRIGLKERSFLKESVSAFQLGGVVRLSRRILIVTACVEGLGALLLAIRFVPMLGLGRGLWYALFHAVSAFCNAGFDLFGYIEPFGSLTPFAGDWLVSGTIAGLILVGGLGFIVWSDVIDHKFRVSRYQLHTRIILLASFLLVTLSAAALFILEKDASMAGMDAHTRMTASLFQAVSPRTAGFNSVDLAALSEPGSALVMLNMAIGGGPGSTAGGIKITTIVVVILSLVAYTRGVDDVNVGRRRLAPGIERRAFCGMMLYMFMALAGLIALLLINRVKLHEGLFEVISAISTVGLTKGITRSLSEGSLLTLTLLMYAGRVGSLSVAIALTERRRAGALKYPVGQILVG